MRVRYLFLPCLLTLTSCTSHHETHASSSSTDQGISATGTCIKKIVQDRGTLTLTSTVLAPTATESSQAATKENEKLRAALEALKLDNASFETTGFSVYEEREYQDKVYVSRGFRTRIGLNVETSDIARIGEVIAAASQLGIKEVDSLSTFVSPQKMKTEYESCLEVATSNARDKAEKLAKGAGVKLGKVTLIQEGVRTSSGPEMKSMRTMMMGAAAPESNSGPTISTRAEDLTVSASVKFAVE